MRIVDITINRASDGTYSAFCNEHPALFGMGDSPEQAKSELMETLEDTKEIGRDSALIYPDWIDDDFIFNVHWDVRTMLEYYTGIITPTALGKLSGIHPKQIWAYQHGQVTPRRKQVAKIEQALHSLGKELIHTSF